MSGRGERQWEARGRREESRKARGGQNGERKVNALALAKNRIPSFLTMGALANRKSSSASRTTNGPCSAVFEIECGQYEASQLLQAAAAFDSESSSALPAAATNWTVSSCREKEYQ
jgi:hypothetical protein